MFSKSITKKMKKYFQILVLSILLVGCSDDNLETEPLLIDVRTIAEYNSGYIEGAVNYPTDVLVERLEANQIDKNREIILYCRSGFRSANSLIQLQKAGYTNVSDMGGIIFYDGVIVRPNK